MKIRHLVHSCLLVETAGRRLLVDPGGFSADAVRGLGAEELAGLDAVVITHQHPDHDDPALLAEVLRAAPDAEVIAEPRVFERVAKIADIMVGGAERPLTGGATHYHTKSVSPGWSRSFPRTASIGDHYFYKQPTRVSQN